MTTALATPETTPPALAGTEVRDRRGSWVPTWSMVTTRMMEIRRAAGSWSPSCS